MLVSTSWPMPVTTGIRLAAIARATASSLKHHWSSIEPPPPRRGQVGPVGVAPAPLREARAAPGADHPPPEGGVKRQPRAAAPPHHAINARPGVLQREVNVPRRGVRLVAAQLPLHEHR